MCHEILSILCYLHFNKYYKFFFNTHLCLLHITRGGICVKEKLNNFFDILADEVFNMFNKSPNAIRIAAIILMITGIIINITIRVPLIIAILDFCVVILFFTLHKIYPEDKMIKIDLLLMTLCLISQIVNCFA